MKRERRRAVCGAKAAGLRAAFQERIPLYEIRRQAEGVQHAIARQRIDNQLVACRRVRKAHSARLYGLGEHEAEGCFELGVRFGFSKVDGGDGEDV